MPIYEYRCEACSHQLEALQKINEAPLTECPNCHQASLNKLVSAPSFQLKGTGWYVTDFRDKGTPTKPSESSKSGEGGGESSGGTNSDQGSGQQSTSTQAGVTKP